MQSDNNRLFAGLLAVLAMVAGAAGYATGKLLGARSTPPHAARMGARHTSTELGRLAQQTAAAEPGATGVNAGPAEVNPPKPASKTRDAWKTVRYGQSVKGTGLTAEVAGTGKETTIVFGAFHGNEPATPGLVRATRDYLKRHPELLANRRVVLAAIVNPDGLARGRRVNANGVDLNRNFSYGWKKSAKVARFNPGPSPASEPETKAVLHLMATYRPGKVVSVHQPFRTLNYTGAKGKQMARLMSSINGFPITADIGYPTPGSFGDYCGNQLGIGIVTLELPQTVSRMERQRNVDAIIAIITQL